MEAFDGLFLGMGRLENYSKTEGTYIIVVWVENGRENEEDDKQGVKNFV